MTHNSERKVGGVILAPPNLEGLISSNLHPIHVNK